MICPALIAVGAVGTLANSVTIAVLLVKPRMRCLGPVSGQSNNNFFLGSAFYQMLGYLAIFDLTTAVCAVWREVAKTVSLKAHGGRN